MSRRRLLKDLAELGVDANDGIIVMDVMDMGNIDLMLTAPDDSLYATGMFRVKITVDVGSFPVEPPMFNFVSKIFHPNISPVDGEVCVDRLKDKWSHSITLRAACEVVQGLLRDPNPSSPLNVAAARMLRRNPDMFSKIVQMWTKVHAGGSHFDDKYQEALNIVSAVAPSESRALSELTDQNWDIQTSCDNFS